MKTYLAVFILIILSTVFIENGVAQQFTQITEGDIVNEEHFPMGCSWIDYDNDGYLDLFVANKYDQNNSLYHNNGDGTFTKITSGEIVNDGGDSTGNSWGDYDNNGYLDLFVTNGGSYMEDNFLYRSNGDGTFTKITRGDIVNDASFSAGCGWADYDHDGHLDLFVANGDNQSNFLYHHEGNNNFVRIRDGSIVTDGGHSFGCGWADYDNDNDLDLYVANGFLMLGVENFLYRNERDSTFSRITEGEIVTDEKVSRGCSWADYDNDGDLDLFVSNCPYTGSEVNSFYANNGDGTFTPIEDGDIVTIEDCSLGSSWGDYDNDGDLDLFVCRVRDDNIFYENNGDGTFTTITESILTEGRGAYGASWGDYDNDGHLDLFVAIGYDQVNQLFHNEGNDNHWINIKCAGTVSNAAAIGTKVRALAVINETPVWQMRHIEGHSGGYGTQNMLNAHFGFGQTTVIDTLRLEWPSDTVQVFTNIAVDQFLTIHETGMAAVTGMVTDGQNPLPGVRITAVDSSRAHAAISDENGYYHLPLLPGSYTLTAIRFGYEDGTPTIIDTIGPNEELTLDLTLSPLSTGILRGVVSEAYDPETPPISEAEVTILETPVSSVFSDDRGQYRFPEVPTGTYRVRADHPDYASVEREVTIIGEETITLNLPLVAPLSFEETDGDFNGEGGWEWGIPQPEGGPEDVYDGEKCWGTLLDEFYGPFSRMYLITPPYTLVADQPIYKLHFHHWYDTDNGWDGGNVQVSTDGGENWTLIHPEGGYPDVNIPGLHGQPGYTGQYEEWHPAVFDLSEYVGQTVQFRFHFGSTNSPPRFDGWFIDYFYVLGRQVYQVGVDPVDDVVAVPRQYELLPNYPNPFNPRTTIAYALPQRSSVTLHIYDISGKLVQTLLENESQPAGQHTIEWNAGKLSSGVYFYQLSIPDSSPLIRKAVVLK